MVRKVLYFFMSVVLFNNINLAELTKNVDKEQPLKSSIIVVDVDNNNVIAEYLFEDYNEFEKFNLNEVLK